MTVRWHDKTPACRKVIVPGDEAEGRAECLRTARRRNRVLSTISVPAQTQPRARWAAFVTASWVGAHVDCPPEMPDERDELIAALHQLTAFTEGLLTLSERLLRDYDTDARPSGDELAAMRDGVSRTRAVSALPSSWVDGERP
jgi:hypothetical protein